MIYKIDKSYKTKSFSKKKDVISHMYWAPNKKSSRIELQKEKFVWDVELIKKPPINKWSISFDEQTKEMTYYHVGLFEWQMRYQNRHIG